MPPSADREGVVAAAWRVPDLSDSVDAAGCVAPREPVEEGLAARPGPLGDDLDAPVVEIESKATQSADLQRPGPGEPAETHPLNLSPDPDHQPRFFVHGCTLTGQLAQEHLALTRLGLQSRRNDPHPIE
ncbi:hypothetical protein SFR_1666 [Streptomyces sp. FR-008]|nr:hypothetical protein SFR_1666 [Streptomyces sp. FR-008]